MSKQKVRANKRHQCSACLKIIMPGRRYYSEVTKIGKEYRTVKHCIKCGRNL